MVNRISPADMVSRLGANYVETFRSLARLVDGFARRPQVQERLTTQIADALMEELNPMGAACVIEATHTCMTIRGAMKPGSTMVTSALRGIFMGHLLSRNRGRDGLRWYIRWARFIRGPSRYR